MRVLGYIMDVKGLFGFVFRSAVVGLVAAGIVLLLRATGGGDPQATLEIREAHARTPGTMASGPVSYADAVAAAAPAVVNINTAKTVTLQAHPFYDDPFFRQFFGDMILGRDAPRKRVENSLGSGVIVSPQGLILTNHHVVRGADEISVSLQDGRQSQATVIGTDPETDLAVLRIEMENLPAITLGDSDSIRVGDVSLAIGNPFGVGQTVTIGIVSATGRDQLGINTFENFIQTDAAINPGNSGGALIDALGNLVGINTAIFSRSGGSQGIGFAIPINMARDVMQQIVAHGRPIRGWLGFEGQELTPRLAKALEIEDTRGLIITGVVRGGPAHEAKINPGDVLVEVDGEPIDSARSALQMISSRKPGAAVKLTIVRDGRTFETEAIAINRPSQFTGTQLR